MIPRPDRDEAGDHLCQRLQHRLGKSAVWQTLRLRKPTTWFVELDLPTEEVAKVARETLSEIDAEWEHTLALRERPELRDPGPWPDSD